jgi:hypothetical protein
VLCTFNSVNADILTRSVRTKGCLHFPHTNAFISCLTLLHKSPLILGLLVRNKRLREELIACFPLIRHRPHRKRRVQQFCCVYSLRQIVLTQPLPSNDWIHKKTHRMMGGMCEVHRRDVLKCHNIQSVTCFNDYIPDLLNI